ncbi:MAG: TonB-dependent receptor [Candidatus Omnitrophica bacterium]|nr:TonB-dependent receptor [Candidatus Omnitrophota bacterium]
MFKIKLSGFLVVIFLLLPQQTFSSEDRPLDLETLVIAKKRQFLLNTYSISPNQSKVFNYETDLENLMYLPVDLQSRSLRSAVQTDFSLRGSSFSQVLILLNGSRINDPQTAHHNADIPFTKEDIESIDVIPHASSSLFGPDAIGGAINFKLKEAGAKEMILESALGSMRNGYGLISVSDKFRDLGFRVSIEDAQSAGFRYDTDFKKFTTSFSASLALAAGSWDTNFGYQEKEFGAYDFYTPGLGYPSWEKTRTYLAASALTLKDDGFLIKPSFLWRRHFDKFALIRTAASFNDHRTDSYTPGLYLQKEATVLGNLGLGLEWNQERITSTNLGRHNRDRSSIFLDDSFKAAPWLDLGFSLRMDDFSDFDRVYTGSASAKFRLTDKTALSLGVSRNMRIPSFTELYYSDQTTVGNNDLAPEKAWNYQAGIEYKQGSFSSAFVLFLRHERQMIDWVRPDSGQKWQARNFTRDNVFGAEYSIHKEINSLLSLDANYTYTDKIIDNQGFLYKYGANYARHLVNTVFNFDLLFGRQEVGFSYKQRPQRRGWLLVNVGFNYEFNKKLKIFLNSTNILNVEYQDIAGVPQPGRYAEAGLRVEW